MSGIFCGLGLSTDPHSALIDGTEERYPDVLSALQRIANVVRTPPIPVRASASSPLSLDGAGQPREAYLVLTATPYVVIDDWRFQMTLRCLGLPVQHRPLWPVEMFTLLDMAEAARVPEHVTSVLAARSAGGATITPTQVYETFHHIRELTRAVAERTSYVRWQSAHTPTRPPTRTPD